MGTVRIIGGDWRRSLLTVPDLPGLRPSGDRIRETLFNWLGQDLSGWQVIDAFAGSGALGLEAASRGAQVQLVESHRLALQGLKAAVAKLQGASERVRIRQGDGIAALQSGGYQLALLDPPFEAGLFERALAAAALHAQWIYLEAPTVFEPPPGFRRHRQLKAGAVQVHLFARDNPAP